MVEETVADWAGLMAELLVARMVVNLDEPMVGETGE